MLSNYLAAPAGLASPSILSVQARWISIGWNSPTVSGGLLTKYQIKALNARNTTLVIVADVTNTSLRTYSIQGLEPYTLYNLSVVAFTTGGSVESKHIQSRTKEAGECLIFRTIIC